MEMANKVIDTFYNFFDSIGIPMHLGELGVKAEKIEEMADHILENDSTNEPCTFAPLDKSALTRRLKSSILKNYKNCIIGNYSNHSDRAINSSRFAIIVSTYGR